MFSLLIHLDAAKIVMPRCLDLIRDLMIRRRDGSENVAPLGAQMMLLGLQIICTPPKKSCDCHSDLKMHTHYTKKTEVILRWSRT